MTELETLRNEILRLDEEILRLIHKRVQAASKIGQIKRSADAPLQNFAVEKSVLEHALELGGRLGLDPTAVQQFMRTLIRLSVKVQEQERIRRDPTGRHAMVVGGAGLMGAWFARFLSEQGYTVHVDDPKPSPWPKADAERTRYDLVVLATPPSALNAVLERVLPKLPRESVLLDIASVKGPARERLEKAAKAGHRVASIHPMFGPKTDLLMGSNVLVLDCGNADAVRTAQRLFADTAASTHALPLGAHDALMAEVLGLAHAVSIVFNLTLARGRAFDEIAPFASTTFRKQVEVSREVAHENPRLYFEIQTVNPANEAVLARFEEALKVFRAAVTKKDQSGFERIMDQTRSYYDASKETR